MAWSQQYERAGRERARCPIRRSVFTHLSRRIETFYLTVASFLAWAGLSIQWIAILRTNSLASGAWLLLGFFTITTNILAAVFFTMRLLRRDTGRDHWVNRPSPAAFVCASITFVGIGFIALLARLYNFAGLDWWANGLLHYVVPALGLIYFLAFLRGGQLKWTDPLKWSVYVLVYGIYAIIRGGITGFYPYPFIDLPTIGELQVAINMIGLLIAYVISGCLFVFADRTWPIVPPAEQTR